MSFLDQAAPTAEAQRLYDDDLAELGFVMNGSRLWAYQPAAMVSILDLARGSVAGLGLGLRERSILVTACAAALGDSYCALAWGSRLAEAADASTAASVVRGDDEGLTPAEHALAGWARQLALDPAGTTGADVQVLRDAGYDDAFIFAVTVFVALRIAFSTVNDALGALPDAAYRSVAPPALLDAVTFGRPIEPAAPPPSAPPPSAPSAAPAPPS